MGDHALAAKYAADLRKAAPHRAELFLKRPPAPGETVDSTHGLRLFEGLRVALATLPAPR
jgi:hypothetical protein